MICGALTWLEDQAASGNPKTEMPSPTDQGRCQPLLAMAPIHYSSNVKSLFSAQSWGHCHSQDDLWSTVPGLMIQQIRSCQTAEMTGSNLIRSTEELLPSLPCRWQRKCTRLDDELLNSIDSAFWSGVDRNNHASQDEQEGWKNVCKEGKCKELQSCSVQGHSSQGLIHLSEVQCIPCFI